MSQNFQLFDNQRGENDEKKKSGILILQIYYNSLGNA